MRMSDTAVILLNYKTWEETLEETRLLHEKLNMSYEDMIVVDNSSPNDSAKRLSDAAKKRGYVFLKSLENRGYAAGNNIGLRYAAEKNYKYALILNNDILFTDQDTIRKLERVLRQDERVAVVNPDIYSPDGYLYNRDALRPSFYDMTVGMYSYRKKGRNLKDLGGYGYIYRPQGCCMLVDLKKLREADYLDERTFLYVEEPILAERLAAKGYVCACCVETSVVHNHSKTVQSAFQKKEVRRIHNKSYAYYLKEYRKFGAVKRTICLLFHTMKLIVLK